MGALRTLSHLSTIRTSGHARRGVALAQQAAADRRARELRARGWVPPAAAPWDIRAAEYVLSEQMRARAEMRDEAAGLPRPSRYWIPVGIALGGLPFLIAAFVVDPAFRAGPAVMVLGVLAAAGVAGVMVGRRERRRTTALALAVDIGRVCGWCGATTPHVLEGVATPPRVFHAAEIDRFVRGG